MWNPPIALTSEEQKIAARTRKTRKFFVFLREHRHELLDADFQYTLAQSSSPEPGGQAPVEAGLLALATLLQASCHVGDRDAVELTVMAKRWQMVLDCLGAEQPPFSQGTLFNFRMRLIAHNLDKTLLKRTVALAETAGGFGARQLRAVLDSTPRFGAGRVEDTLNLLGHALRQAVGLVAQELGTAAEAVVEDAGLTLVGHSSLQAALDLDWGEPRARERALGLVLEEVGRWQRWLEQQTLAAEQPPLKEVMDTMAQMVTQDTEPDPDGSPLAAGVSRSTSRLSGASRSRIKTCATAARAVQKPSTASQSTLPSMWRAQSSGRSWSVRPMRRSMRQSNCWPRSWRKPPACCSSIAIWGTWPAPGWPHGRSRVSTLSHVLGRKVVRFLPNMIARWTVQGCR
jgi:hypothetical protein